MSSADEPSDGQPAFVKESLEALRQRSQWVCWNTEGKPVHPHSGETVDEDDSGTSLDVAKREFNKSDYEGLGFLLQPGDEITGIRLLNGVSENSDGLDVEEWAGEVIQRVDSYAEISVSGGDILMLAEGEIPEGPFESDKVEFTSAGPIPISGNSANGFETIHSRQRKLESVFTDFNQYESPEDEEVEEEVAEEDEAINEDITLADVRETVRGISVLPQMFTDCSRFLVSDCVVSDCLSL